jgi:negative regulator of sigma E activity
MKPPPDKTQPLPPEEQENLSAYLDQELDEAGTEQVTAALSRRPEVRKEADSLRKTWELLDYLPRPKAPQSFTEQTLTRLNSTKGILLQQGIKWRRYAIAGWAAAVLLAAVFGFWLTYFMGRDPEIVEVQAPVQDVLPTLESSHIEPVSTVVTPTVPVENKLPKKDFKVFQRSQAERDALNKQRNDRLIREIGRVLNALRTKATDAERTEMAELSREGGLPYMAKVLELANKYKIPLKVAPASAEGTAPVKGNAKKPNKTKDAGE